MNDLAFKYFKAALVYWLQINKKTQNWLALEVGVTDGTISRYMTSKRGIPFKKQIVIANACGYEYEKFLNLGRSILLAQNQQNPEWEQIHSSISIGWRSEKPEHPAKNIIDLNGHDPPLTHEKIILKFKDKDLALHLNSLLVDIETAAPDDYKAIQKYIEFIHQGIVVKKKENGL